MADSNDMKNMGMNWDGIKGKERFDAQMRIVDHYNSRCAGRMSNGWKISLALWSSLGLLAGALITKRVSIGNDDFRCFVFILLGLVFAAYSWLVWVIALDNRQDLKDIRETFKPIVEWLEVPTPNDQDWWPRVYYSQIFQWVITAVLLACVWLAYCNATAGQCKPILIQCAQALKQCAQALMECAQALMQSAQLIMEK